MIKNFQIVNFAKVNPSHTGWYLTYLHDRDGRLRWPWNANIASRNNKQNLHTQDS